LKITYEENFIRIFRLPKEYPSDFCFGGGHPVAMQLVDWFNPIGPNEIPEDIDLEEIRKKIREFVKGKVYYWPRYKYLAITDYEDAFLI